MEDFVIIRINIKPINIKLTKEKEHEYTNTKTHSVLDSGTNNVTLHNERNRKMTELQKAIMNRDSCSAEEAQEMIDDMKEEVVAWAETGEGPNPEQRAERRGDRAGARLRAANAPEPPLDRRRSSIDLVEPQGVAIHRPKTEE